MRHEYTMRNLVPCVARWWSLGSLEVKTEKEHISLVKDSRKCWMHDRLWDRTYRLRRVHVWITPRVVRSVCGQHHFIDLLRLNNAIFCRGGKKKDCVIAIMHDDQWERHYITLWCISTNRRKAAYTWMHQTKGVWKSRHELTLEISACENHLLHIPK